MSVVVAMSVMAFTLTSAKVWFLDRDVGALRSQLGQILPELPSSCEAVIVA